MTDRDRAGLYVHIPFCLTRCGYCDFNTYAGLGHLRAPYTEALGREGDLVAPGWRDVEFVSIFLGGGTPTLLTAVELEGMLAHLRRSFPVAEDAEITCEANPDTVEEASLTALRRAGVSRVSIGAQSFDGAVLAALERIHPADAAARAFRAARRAGFDDVNLDLIYGAHGETLSSWRETLARTIDLGPDHVSAYALTVEPATALGRKVAAGMTRGPDPDVQADMYETACDLLRSAGYEHYEVSNWARPGRRCVHNLGYWEGRPYLGLGAGAHSHRDGRRWWNVRPPSQYLEMVGRGLVPVGGEERLTRDERRLERLLLALRTFEGLPEGELRATEAEELVAARLLERRGDRLAATDAGMLLANELVLRLTG